VGGGEYGGVSTPAATAAGRRRASARSSRSKPSRSKPARRPAAKQPQRRASQRARGSTRFSLASWRVRVILVAILAGALAITYFAWFRHSSFVAIQSVKVEGVSSADRARVTAALTNAAQGMSTLDVDASKLAGAVSGFPTVASVTANPSFPHGLTVHVTERDPVLVASDGQRQVAVAAGGSLLPGVDVGGSNLPVLKVDSIPASGRLGGESLDEARVIAAAPSPLRPLIEGTTTTHDYGIVITLRRGIDLRFGAASKSQAKWAAAAAVLADPKVTTLDYVDVRVPSRPAIGG
jgi:cell division protein FtsQ